MSQTKELAEDQIVRQASRLMRKFYSELEPRVRRYPPHDYVTFCADRLADCMRSRREFVKTPPHRVLHSIEANIAYHKTFLSDKINWNKFARIMNYYSDYSNSPFLAHTIDENHERFFLMMRREQFELQFRASPNYLAKMWSIFVDNRHAKKLDHEFHAKYGLSLEQWFHLLALLYFGVIQLPTRRFVKDMLLNCEFYSVEEKSAQSLYRLISYNFEHIKENYVELRKQVDPAYHFLIRSVFLKRPVVDLEDGNMIAPHPDLIFRLMGEGAIQLAGDLDGYEDCISEGLENYVYAMLENISGKKVLLQSKEMESIVKKATGGKSCDFLVETENEIILLECKATTFTANMFTDKAILNNNSTGQIAKALIQLYTTVRDVNSEVFVDLGIDHTKRIVGVVITLGEIFGVDSDWYFNKFIMHRAKDKLDSSIYPSQSMPLRPAIITVDALEDLVMTLNNENGGVSALYNERSEAGYHAVGDWVQHLKHRGRHYGTLPYIKEVCEKCFKSMGIDRNMICDANDS